MAQFIGLHMLVTLNDPPGAQLKGTVSEICAGNSLTLSNVFVVGSKDKWIPRLEVESSNIVDLSEIQPAQPSTFTAPSLSSVAAPIFPQPSQPSFEDPAVLSFGTKPISLAGNGRTSGAQTKTAEKTVPQPVQAGGLPAQHAGSGSGERTPVRLGTPHKNTAVSSNVAGGGVLGQSMQDQQDPSFKKNRRKPKAKQAQNEGHTAEGGSFILDSSPPRAPRGARGKGWRQTPILQSTASFQPFNSLKRDGARNKKPPPENGWASEDVTEDMGEFDFQGGLAKFDKHALFDQMRKDDQIDDGDRLVSHNRRAKPGTAGGKNLHHTENVLDTGSNNPKPSSDFWASEADEVANAEERQGGRDLKSAQSNRRGESRAAVATRRSQSRKASAATVGQPLNRVNSSQGYQAGLYLLPSNRRVETVSALQMLNLENIAANEVGLTQEMMAENAGRAIAQVSLSILTEPAIRIRMESNGGPLSGSSTGNIATIVILAGNNKSGARTLSAARHLRSRVANVMVCLVGVEREQELVEDLRQQMSIYRKLGGKIYKKQELFEQIRKSTLSDAPITVSLIIDALLGLNISFEELRKGDQTSVYELIEWANRNDAFVLAIDVPTGIDPSTGKVSIIDGSRLYIKPRYVIAMGAPKRGLVEALSPVQQDRDGSHGAKAKGALAADGDEWDLFIADIGLGAAVWKKAGTKLRRGIDFDDKWVLEMTYRGEEPDEEEGLRRVSGLLNG